MNKKGDVLGISIIVVTVLLIASVGTIMYIDYAPTIRVQNIEISDENEEQTEKISVGGDYEETRNQELSEESSIQTIESNFSSVQNTTNLLDETIPGDYVKIKGYVDNPEDAESLDLTYRADGIRFDAIKLFGQRSSREIAVNMIVPNRAYKMGGIQVDTSESPNRIYVADVSNNRVLGFERKRNANDDADIVIGQPSFYYGACNHDGTKKVSPGPDTLCLIGLGSDVISTTEAGTPISMATDKDGNLYVPDAFNNRVLKYENPFEEDSVADEVWGQNGFYTNECNKDGISEDSLCFQKPGLGNDHAGASVDIDDEGNLWVGDTMNYRVLRFPKGSKTADLVLGQSNFNSVENGCSKNPGLQKMCMPVEVKVDSNGDVYVIDQHIEVAGQGDSRVLIFKAPFSNGMSASSEIYVSKMERLRNLVLDSTGQGDFWLSDVFKLVLIKDGKKETVLGRNNLGSMGDTDCETTLPAHPAACLERVGGEIGIDEDGNLYVPRTAGGAESDEIVIYSTPVSEPPFSKGLAEPDDAMLSYGDNKITGRSFRDNQGMAIFRNQLFVSDRSRRILVFDDYLKKENYAHADYVIGTNSFDNIDDSIFGRIDGLGHIFADKNGLLWVAAGRLIYVYQLPITKSGTNVPTVKILEANKNVVWADNNQPAFFWANGIVYDEENDALWIGDHYGRRVFRISNPLGNANVDLVIGQTSKDASECNLGGGNEEPAANTLCGASFLALDNENNLYVVDSSYEGGANRRILEYDEQDVMPVSGNIFPLPEASNVYAKPDFSEPWECNADEGPCSPVTVSFDEDNQMFVSTDSYGNEPGKKLWVYENPLNDQEPDYAIPIDFGQPAVTLFDADGNLIVQDHTWNRIIVLEKK